ncbi:MAG: VacJ family lipoprotein [Steroidobacteraceae bacterium]
MKAAACMAAALLVLGGCASPTATIRKVPDETPAADNAAATANATAFAEAVASESGSLAAQNPREALPLITPEDAPPMYTYDPWERMNRFTYRFNARFDEAIFLPAANAYRRAPAPVRDGIHNFFGNLSEVDSVINHTLQGRLKYVVRSVGRFVINSTLGFGGLIDVAAKLKMPAAPTGFATTLAKWGMHPGPYLVLPFLGPSTLRGGVGFAADYGTSYEINVAGLYRGDAAWGLGVTNAVDQRANVGFRYYSSGSPFEYERIRFLYVRKILIEDEGLHANPPRKKSEAEEPAGK